MASLAASTPTVNRLTLPLLALLGRLGQIGRLPEPPLIAQMRSRSRPLAKGVGCQRVVAAGVEARRFNRQSIGQGLVLETIAEVSIQLRPGVRCGRVAPQHRFWVRFGGPFFYARLPMRREASSSLSFAENNKFVIIMV